MLEWIEEAREGNEEAFGLLVKQFTGMAYVIAYELLGDPYLAEDALQEAFAQAYVHLKQLDEPKAFPGWLKTIVVRQCHRLKRRKHLPVVSLEDALQTADNQADVHAIAERRERARQLHASVADLSAPLRLAVHLFYFEGYSLQEISACLGPSTAVLKKRLFDARKKLRGMLPVADFVSVVNELYEGGKSMLHIVNGDYVGKKLQRGGITGEVLVWREVYPEGPVFNDAANAANRDRRAQYLEEAMGIPYADFIKISEAQEQQLAGFRQYEDIVLWFEHDLFDQTMLCCLLNWFSKQELGATRLHLLCIGDFPGIQLFRGLGQLTAEQLMTLSGTWSEISREELELGREVWEAYTSNQPEALLQLVRQDTSILPYVQEAFRLHLARYPSIYNGLGIVEQTTLEMVMQGVNSPTALFQQVGDRLHGLGMGDLQYWICLKDLTEGAHPLLHMEGGTTFPDYKQIPDTYANHKLTLSDYGLQVLNGQGDWISRVGIDKWYGGVHLHGQTVPWRWDEGQQRLIHSR